MVDPSQVTRHCEETEVDNLLTLSVEQSAPNVAVVGASQRASDWQSAPEFRAECLKALRWNFDYVLIDCPSIVSSEATTLAPLVDGVSVVVRAARTRRGQIQRCQQVIENAGGNFLGFILNQRQYSVPNWLYRRL
jgi:Mrp family chromosome partitioning ATPase